MCKYVSYYITMLMFCQSGQRWLVVVFFGGRFCDAFDWFEYFFGGRLLCRFWLILEISWVTDSL